MSKLELDTEGKIKLAAQKVFHEKGFDATKTRDIAEEAGINLALLNYYFRSKRKLYDLIMMETLQSFFGAVVNIMNDETTTIHEKLSAFVAHYIDTISKNQDIPMFILNEIRVNPDNLMEKIFFKEKILTTVFAQQFKTEVAKGNVTDINPIHLLLNLSSMVVFPFIAKPLISAVTEMPDKNYLELMQERKKLIPMWIEMITKK